MVGWCGVLRCSTPPGAGLKDEAGERVCSGSCRAQVLQRTHQQRVVGLTLHAHLPWPQPCLDPSPLQVGAIRGSCQREPTVVGKPADFMLKNIAQQFNLQPSQICMVGDRLDTDILFGKGGGLTTALVLSGVTTEEKLTSPENKIQPDLYMDALPDLLTVKDKLCN